MLKHVKIRERENKKEKYESNVEGNVEGIYDIATYISPGQRMSFDFEMVEMSLLKNFDQKIKLTDLESDSKMQQSKNPSQNSLNSLAFDRVLEPRHVSYDFEQDEISTINVAAEIEKIKARITENQGEEIDGEEIQSKEMKDIESFNTKIRHEEKSRTVSESTSDYSEINYIYDSIRYNKSDLVHKVKGSSRNNNVQAYQTLSLDRHSSFLEASERKNKNSKCTSKEAIRNTEISTLLEKSTTSKSINQELLVDTEVSTLLENSPIIELERISTENKSENQSCKNGCIVSKEINQRKSKAKKNHIFLLFLKYLNIILTSILTFISAASVTVFYIFLGFEFLLNIISPISLYFLILFAFCLTFINLFLLFARKKPKFNGITIYNIIFLIFIILSFILLKAKRIYYDN